MKAFTIIIIAIGGIAILGIVLYFAFLKGPDLRAYLPLKEPRLETRGAERVLEVRFSGPARTVVQRAYKVLFRAYYSLRGCPRGGAMKAPKARYSFGMDASRPAAEQLARLGDADWTGAVAIAVPDSAALPDRMPETDGLRPELATWEYGEVAEILHIGSYASEAPTIQKLQDFIKAQGYKIVDDHEEEYLRGPGVPFVSPEGYWTIIRYRVEKAD